MTGKTEKDGEFGAIIHDPLFGKINVHGGIARKMLNESDQCEHIYDTDEHCCIYCGEEMDAGYYQDHLTDRWGRKACPECGVLGGHSRHCGLWD